MYKRDPDAWSNRDPTKYARTLVNKHYTAQPLPTHAQPTGPGLANNMMRHHNHNEPAALATERARIAAENEANRKKAQIATSKGFPGIATFSVDRIRRLQANRLFVKRAHLSRLLAAEGLFAIAVRTLLPLSSALANIDLMGSG